MRTFILTAMAVLLSVGASAQEVTVNGAVRAGTPYSHNYENYIQVTGKAEKLVVPDEITIRIVINESEMKLKKNIEDMEREMIAKLRSLGIDTEKNLKIDNMSSDFKDYFLKKGQARTSASYQLKTNSAAQLGVALQGLESIGISNISIIKLSHSKIKEFQREVRMDAIRNAKEIAVELTEALGQGVGPAVSIIDYNSDFYIPTTQTRNASFALKVAGSTDSYYETELDFNEIKLSYNITVKFAFDGTKQ